MPRRRSKRRRRRGDSGACASVRPPEIARREGKERAGPRSTRSRDASSNGARRVLPRGYHFLLHFQCISIHFPAKSTYLRPPLLSYTLTYKCCNRLNHLQSRHMLYQTRRRNLKSQPLTRLLPVPLAFGLNQNKRSSSSSLTFHT